MNIFRRTCVAVTLSAASTVAFAAAGDTREKPCDTPTKNMMPEIAKQTENNDAVLNALSKAMRG